MKSIINWFNGVLFVFLLILCTGQIFTGEIWYSFFKEWHKRSDSAFQQRQTMMSHDSAETKRTDALLKGQIETHLEILQLKRQIDSLRFKK